MRPPASGNATGSPALASIGALCQTSDETLLVGIEMERLGLEELATGPMCPL